MPVARFRRSSAVAAHNSGATTPVTKRLVVRLTANFERNLADVERLTILLAIKHHRQISFDFESQWGAMLG